MHTQDVGKPSRNAAQPCAMAQGDVNDDLRTFRLRKGWGFRVGTCNVDSLTGSAGEVVEALLLLLLHSFNGIIWAICKSALCPRQITMPAPHHSVFYRPDALPATNQQRHSTEGIVG